LIIKSKNGLDIVNHQTYDSITAGGLIDISNTQNGILNIRGNIRNKKGDTKLYGSDGILVSGGVYSVDGDITMTAPKGDLTLAKGSMVYTDKGNVTLHQHDILGNLNMVGQVILRDGDITTDSFGNETDNGLIFGREFSYENESKDIIITQQTENDYTVSSNMDFGYDVSKDIGINSSSKVLRMNSRGATIVNDDNWKTGEKHDFNLSFDDVNITVKCYVMKTENNLAQVKFVDLPKDVANKITYYCMKLAYNK